MGFTVKEIQVGFGVDADIEVLRPTKKACHHCGWQALVDWIRKCRACGRPMDDEDRRRVAGVAKVPGSQGAISDSPDPVTL